MLENISLAFQGIWGHKLRSFLTMLGIIIGIASIITIVSTIKGTNDQIKESLIGAGNNVVTVQLYQDSYAYDMEYLGPPAGVTPITEETRQALLELDHVRSVSLYCWRTYLYDSIYYGNTGLSDGNLNGVDRYYFETNGLRLCYGRLFVEEDETQFRKVAILDAAACSSLFAGKDPIGKILEIKGEPFTVVGVVEQASTSDSIIETVDDYYTYKGYNTSGVVYIPLADWPILWRFDEPQSVSIRADSTDAMTDIGKAAADLLTASQTANATSTSFSYKSDDLMEQAAQIQEYTNATNKQLLWIAGISLLVGGIGVMNIMLVTVTERTREIGLKKAIGAKKRRILWQFLTEAAALTSIGGVVGVAAGLALSRFISSAMGTPTAISYPAIGVAVVFSMFIGVIFGMIPAVKAAKLNPIDALRRE